MKTEVSRIPFEFIRIPARPGKPRQKGLTVVSDNGTPISYLQSILEVAGEIIDCAKLTDHAGLAYRYRWEWLQNKISLYKSYGIPVLPGGSIFEMAYLQGNVELFFQRAVQLGFGAVEVSDAVMPSLTREEKTQAIAEAKGYGLKVFTEVGRKSPTEPFSVESIVEEIRLDLQRGSEKVTVEESEILLLQNEPEKIIRLAQEVGLECIMFEARSQEVQAWLIRILGPEVNLENINMSSHDSVITLERMRRNLHRAIGYKFLS